MYLNRNPDLGLSNPEPESPFLNLFLTGEVTEVVGKRPRWMVIFASDPRLHSLSTWTTSECVIPRTLFPLISIRTSPSCKILHLGLSRIFFTFWPNAESAIVNPKPMPPLVIPTVMTLLSSTLSLNKSALLGRKWLKLFPGFPDKSGMD